MSRNQSTPHPKQPQSPTLQSLVHVALGCLEVRVPEHSRDLFDGEDLGQPLGELHLASDFFIPVC